MSRGRPAAAPYLPGYVLLGAALALAPAPGRAQGLTGQLSVAVTDPSGAVVPEAGIVLTDESSGSVRRSTSNSEGVAVFVGVPPGTFTVSVESPGLAKWERTGLELRLGEKRTLSVRLNVAGLSEEVAVTAAAARIPIDSGEKSATLTADQIENITILGRSAAELLRVLPGLTPVTGTNNRPAFSGEVIGIASYGDGGPQSALSHYSANGSTTYALDIQVDGAAGADVGCNCATPVNPNPEFTQEFKVLQSNFGAEYSRGPVAIQAVSKSGGRDFHGSAYTYVRHYSLNANEPIDKALGRERPENEFYFPGFTLSGPLLIPGTGFNRNRDKVFFFVGWERFQQRLDTGLVRSKVPTAAMRNGDFSEAGDLGLGGGAVTAIPSLDGTETPVIPAGLIDPGGRVLLNAFPLPNADARETGGFNYVDRVLFDQNGSQLLTRLDFDVSDNTKLFLRYNRQRERQPFPIGLWWRNGERQVPYPSRTVADNESDSLTTSLTHVLDPTLTSETIIAATYVNFPNRYEDPSKVQRSALGYPYGGIYDHPDNQIPAFMGDWGPDTPAYVNPGGFDPVLFARKWQVSAAEHVTKVAGAHTLKVGAFYQWTQNCQPGSDWSNGYIVAAPWGGNSTGNVFADLLMGRVTQYQEGSTNVLRDIRYHQVEGYVQDSWRVRPRLTLEAGLRVSHLGGWYDGQGNGLVVFDPARYSPSAPGGDYPGMAYNAIDPAIPKTGARVKGIYLQPRVGFAWDVKGTGDTVVRGGFGAYRYHDPQQPYDSVIDFAYGRRSSFIGDATTLAAIDELDPGDLTFGGGALAVDDRQQPLTYSWSLTLQQRLPGSINLEMAYVGNDQKHLSNRGVSNVNAEPWGARLADPEAGSWRPLPNYGDLEVFDHSLYGNYHSLQTLLSRQRGRVNFTLAYTFSKNLGVRGDGYAGAGSSPSASVLPVRDTLYGFLGTDRTHVLNLAYSIQLPDVKRGGLVRALFGGWQISGLTNLVSGAPLQVTRAFNLGLTGTGADGQDITSEAWTGSQQIGVAPLLTCNPSENVPSGYLFNPACFSLPAPGQVGNYVFDMRGAWYHNHDLSLFKNFSIGQGGKKLQLRVQAYNLLNHPLSFPEDGRNLTLRFENGQRVEDELGQQGRDKYGRRIIQLGVRFSF